MTETLKAESQIVNGRLTIDSKGVGGETISGFALGVKAMAKYHYHVDKALGRRLREERRASGLSEEQLAQKLKIDPEDVSAYESGKRRVSADYLLRIARALDMSPVSFFRFSDEWRREAAEPDEEGSAEALTHPAILDEGLRLNRAFARINNAEIRKTIVIAVDELTKSERAE